MGSTKRTSLTLTMAPFSELSADMMNLSYLNASLGVSQTSTEEKAAALALDGKSVASLRLTADTPTNVCTETKHQVA